MIRLTSLYALLNPSPTTKRSYAGGVYEILYPVRTDVAEWGDDIRVGPESDFH